MKQFHLSTTFFTLQLFIFAYFTDLIVISPDALVQRAQLSHQFCGSFVLVAAQVVNGLYGFGRRLQFVFVDVDPFILE